MDIYQITDKQDRKQLRETGTLINFLESRNRDISTRKKNMAPQLHILFEHAAGYALFRVKEFEEVSMLEAEVQESATDLARFQSVVKLVAFSPFKSGTNALDNINCITEGVVHDDLKLFLETNMPKASKKSKSTLGVADSKITAPIADECGISCQASGVVPEIIRGIRLHFHKLLSGLTEETASKAQLGLGHSYSRAKVKFNVNKADNMIIQCISLLDQLDKDINTFSMRIREWYSYHFPELVKIVTDNYTYAKCAKLIGERKTLTADSVQALEEIVMDSAKAEAIVSASKSSMGMDISPIDLINIARFTDRVIGLTDYRKGLHEYLSSKMHTIAPNMTALIGEQVGARLISHAGSLTNLAKYPASTVQILGAEKALFRALKTRGNTPKYGLIFHSTFIGRAAAKNKGRISRYLANKTSIASRLDCFSDHPNSVIGEFLRNQVEDRLTFYETGEKPKTNEIVMSEAIQRAKDAVPMASKINGGVVANATTPKSEKKKKKKEKRKHEESVTNGDVSMDTSVKMETTLETTQEIEDGEPVVKKKKKNKKKKEVTITVTENGEKKKANITMETTLETTMETTIDTTMDTTQEGGDGDAAAIEKKKKKKKKNKNKEIAA